MLTGGGGYELVQVVPRTWTHLLAEAAGRPLDPAAATPGAWRDFVRARTGARPPEIMTEGAAASFSPFSSGYDPGDRVDRAIMATRKRGFPAARAAAVPLTRVSWRRISRQRSVAAGRHAAGRRRPAFALVPARSVPGVTK